MSKSPIGDGPRPDAASLARRCGHAFRTGDRARGDDYLAAGRVRLGPADEGGVTAEVSGSDLAPYDVVVDWSDAARTGILAVGCDCPRFAGGALCKHLWATLRAVDARGQRAPGAGRLDVIPESSSGARLWDGDELDEEDEEDETWTDPPVTGEGSAVRAPHRPDRAGPRGSAAWQRRLRDVTQALRRAEAGGHAGEGRPASDNALRRRVELWLQIDLASTKSTGELTIDLFQREERKGGGMGALKPLVLSRDTAGRLTGAGDRSLAGLIRDLPSGENRWMLSYRGRYGADHWRVRTFRVPAALYELVLPRLAAGGRLGWWHGGGRKPGLDRRLAWDEGPPWRLTLRLRRNEESGGATLAGELVREGETISVTAPVVMLATGLVLFPDRIGRFEAADSFGWISTLRHQGAIEIPEDAIGAAVRALADMPALPSLTLDDELPIEHATVPARPLLALELGGGADRGEGGGVRGRLGFLYGDQRVDAGDVRSLLIERGAGGRSSEEGPAPPVRMLRREPRAETAARRRLTELGGVPHRDGEAFVFPAHGFTAAAGQLLDEGWRLEGEGRPLRRAGGFQLSVATGIDWFDLTGQLEFDGEAVPLPKLLEAVRRGRSWVELGDGSHGMLPGAWLERFGALAGLASAVEENGEGGAGSLRFLPSQALLLDALLSSTPATLVAEVEVDQGFARLRERLEDGHQIAPMDEPEGFRGELRRYQKEGLGWLSFLADVGLGGCLADDMGLGKTIQVLALLLAKKAARGGGASSSPTLVVAPRSLVYNWLDEATRFAPGLATLDYTGTARNALRPRLAEHDLVVTTYGTLRRDAAALAKLRFGLVVLDEGQAIKNASSQTAKAARLLQADHRLVLSGTPIENHLAELGSLFEFLNPGMLGRSSRLQELTTSRRSAAPDLSDVARALGPFILRRTKAEVLPELPAKTEQTLVITLGRRQRALYDELRDHYRAQLTRRIGEVGLARSKMQVLEALLRLRQMACHPGLLDPERAGEASAKLEAFREQLAGVLDEGHKALVFSQFTRFLALVRRDLDRDGIHYQYLDGKTRDRAARVERFQEDPDERLFLISLKAGGTGLNLTAADYVFLLDPWWNPAVEAQAVDRAHRIGQERPVIAYRLVARDTVEEKILELQAVKRDLAEAVLAGSGSALGRMSAQDLDLLLS